MHLPFLPRAHTLQVDEAGEGKAGRGLGRVQAKTVEDKGVESTCSENLLHERSKPQNASSPRKGEVRMSVPPSSSCISMSIGADELSCQARIASYRDKPFWKLQWLPPQGESFQMNRLLLESFHCTI